MEESRSEIESNSWRRGEHAGGLALVLALATGCQSYLPRPLEPEVHREAWHARALEGGSLEAFLKRLDASRGGEPSVFDPSDGLSLEEGQLVALAFHPRLRLARLRAQGFVDDELARIHGPVGLALGATSPAEIAVSILAQITRVLRGAAPPPANEAET